VADERKEKAIALADKGRSAKEIAAEVGVFDRQVRMILKDERSGANCWNDPR